MLSHNSDSNAAQASKRNALRYVFANDTENNLVKRVFAPFWSHDVATVQVVSQLNTLNIYSASFD